MTDRPVAGWGASMDAMREARVVRAVAGHPLKMAPGPGFAV
jgi:hypothetical protein